MQIMFITKISLMVCIYASNTACAMNNPFIEKSESSITKGLLTLRTTTFKRLYRPEDFEKPILLEEAMETTEWFLSITRRPPKEDSYAYNTGDLFNTPNGFKLLALNHSPLKSFRALQEEYFEQEKFQFLEQQATPF